MRVLFFAQLKDVTGCDSMELTINEPLSSDQLWVALLARFPALAKHRASVRLACNSEYAGPRTHFSQADEAALIPPVSGG